jgi:hypothetical protein
MLRFLYTGSLKTDFDSHCTVHSIATVQNTAVPAAGNVGRALPAVGTGILIAIVFPDDGQSGLQKEITFVPVKRGPARARGNG